MIGAGAASWSHPSYQGVADLLGARTGLWFSASRVADAEAGIRRAMSRAEAADPSSYLRDLQAGLVALDDLIAELTVGESYFFREPLHWELIRSEILPALQRARPQGRGLRIWSAGCSSGEEPYSLAILLEEAGLAASAQLLATDLSRAALLKAEAACYGPWSLRGVDPAVIARYFSPEGSRWRLHRRLRERVRFASLNLAADRYPSHASGTWGLDLVLCRNVLIYLDPITVRRVGVQLGECLAPGGWLITGPSDPPVDEDGRLEHVVTGAGVVYRKAEASVASVASVAISEDRRPPSLPPPAADGGGRGCSYRSDLLPRPSAGGGGREGGVGVTPISAAPDPLTSARAAFTRGDYDAVLALTHDLPDATAAALHIRALANSRGAVEAERMAHGAVARYPRSEELQLLRAVLLLDLGRYKEAAQAARRALYLDRALAMGHFLLGSALARIDDRAGAQQAFRNARTLCAQLPPQTPVRFGDGQRAARLAEAAEAQLEMLAPRKAS